VGGGGEGKGKQWDQPKGRRKELWIKVFTLPNMLAIKASEIIVTILYVAFATGGDASVDAAFTDTTPWAFVHVTPISSTV
jgi:hypothetical protein